MATIQDLKEFAEKELKRIEEEDGSDDPLRDFETLKELCEWIVDMEVA